jgi:hypothetical protein
MAVWGRTTGVIDAEMYAHAATLFKGDFAAARRACVALFVIVRATTPFRAIPI